MNTLTGFNLRRGGPLALGLLLLALPLVLLRTKSCARPALPHNVEQRSRGIIHNANDAIISTDETQTIVLANPSAAAMFGTTVQEMQGATLDKYIPREQRTACELATAPYFGETGISLRMVGRRASDCAVTGIKANGEYFPLEASMSSLVEDDKPIYTIILRDITERKQVQEKLEQSYAQLRDLSATLQTIREEERTHIARELHDDLGQLLATLRVDLTLLQRQKDPNPAVQTLLQGMDKLIVSAITSLRRIASNLRPRALDEGGLFFALQTLRHDFLSRHAIHFELLADEAELSLDDHYSTAIFRIVQEALTNITRHANAHNVTVALYRLNSHLSIAIQDDGRGIGNADLDKASSFGLIGMRERVLGLNGDITISGSDGTRIDIVLPMPSERTGAGAGTDGIT